MIIQFDLNKNCKYVNKKLWKLSLIQTESKKAKALKQFLKAFGVAFKVEKEDYPYNPVFVKKILERSKSAREGNTIIYDEDLKKRIIWRMNYEVQFEKSSLIDIQKLIKSGKRADI